MSPRASQRRGPASRSETTSVWGTRPSTRGACAPARGRPIQSGISPRSHAVARWPCALPLRQEICVFSAVCRHLLTDRATYPLEPECVRPGVPPGGPSWPPKELPMKPLSARPFPSSLPRFAVTLFVLAVALPANAVLLRDGDGTQNTSPPADDPGWVNVGQIYSPARFNRQQRSFRRQRLGPYSESQHQDFDPRWRSPDYTVEFGGTTSHIVPNSLVHFESSAAIDLALFRVHPIPQIPNLALAAAPAPVGTAVVMIGRGHDRAGSATVYNGQTGFLWDLSHWTKRWGTNTVSFSSPEPVPRGVRSERRYQ